MLTFARHAATWAARHALPATAATVLVVGAAGGGIGYEIAGHHSAAATASGSTAAPPWTQGELSTRGHASGAAGQRAGRLLERGLAMLATATGQSVDQVRSQLMAGRSINDIAGSKAPAIQASVLAEVTRLADRAVAAKKITADQEAAGLATARTRIAALMAEPGTQLIKDAQQLLQFLHSHAHAHRGAVPAFGVPAPGT